MTLDNIYVCPKTGEPLKFRADTKSTAINLSGDLIGNNGISYPVIDGVPRFVSSNNYAESFGFQWKLHAKTQLDALCNSSYTADQFFSGTGWPSNMRGQRILEVGCGAGRYTDVLLKTGATVFSFDYSLAAEVAHEQFRELGSNICQASLYEMPYPKDSFDRVFCYGVLQHTPDVHKAFNQCVSMVKPGGHLAVAVYDGWRKWVHAKYRVRWLTRRLPKELLYRWCKKIVPIYLKLMPPLHPFNQVIFPIKDYRGNLPGMPPQTVVEWCILDTFDMLSARYDSPQTAGTLKKWCREANLVDINVRPTWRAVEVTARRGLD